MSIRTSIGISVIGVLASGCGAMAVADLDQRIAQRKAEVERLTSEIVAAAPPPFKPSHELHAELRYRPLQAWLAAVTTPALVISADGISAAGDVVYQGGVGKAWLEPAHDTKVRLSIRDLVLTPQAGALTWTATAQGTAETRVRMRIFNVGSNILCSGTLPTLQPRGSVTIGPVQAMKLPYTMRFSVPGDVKVSVRCGLGQLGSVGLGFPIGELAESVSSGSIGVGIESAARIELPAQAGGRVYVLRFATQDTAVGMTGNSLVFDTNVSVVVE